MSLPWIDAGAVMAFGYPGAVDALQAALLAGLDPEADPPRQILPAGGGELLVMPAAAAGAVAVKLVTVGGEPRVQGVCVVFDPDTLAPVALVDGMALTQLRTAAVSALAISALAATPPRTATIFGAGPQGRAHLAALRDVLGVKHFTVVRRRTSLPDDAIADADVIVCATTAREPLFDGARVAEHAVVVAVGSHEPEARETDDALAARATVVVESRTSALREAGDVIGPIASGALRAGELVTLADVVRGSAAVLPPGPRLFKSTGMSWEDAVVASAVATPRRR